MTSVNEMHAFKRGEDKGLKAGYDIGHSAGYSEAHEWHKKEKRTMRMYRYAIIFIIAFMLGGITQARAQETAVTTVTVEISAEVVCNPTNCPELPQEDTVMIESTQEESLLQRIWSAILRVIS